MVDPVVPEDSGIKVETGTRVTGVIRAAETGVITRVETSADEGPTSLVVHDSQVLTEVVVG